ncbi:MAG: hypothetical protein WB611_09955 [Stellaceae bacterium]
MIRYLVDFRGDAQLTATRFVSVAEALTSRRFDIPGRALGSIPLFRFIPS